MTNTKTSKRALLSSVIALVLCFSMLIGTTVAWFTDSVSSGVNTITAGNLDIELEYSKNGNDWATVQGTTELFSDVTLWEPGATSVVYLRIRNLGTLGLKYRLSMNVVDEVVGTSVEGNAIRLSEYLKYGIVEGQSTKFASRDAARAAVTNPLTLASYNEVEKQMLAGAADRYFALVVFMPETVGNAANYRGNVIPTIELGLNLVATQLAAETDSFGNDYDTTTYLNQDAEGNFLISNADELVFFAKAINTKIAPYSDAGKKFKLTADIDLGGRRWAPIGRMTDTYGTGESSTFHGNFDGGNYTISNFNVDTVDGIAGDDTNKGAGLFGAVTGTISNLKVKDATIITAHWAGTIAGQIKGTVENCSVENITITCLPELIGTSWDNGDKAGSIVGYLDTNGTVTGCSAKNVSITGYRDLGGIVGCSDGTVTNNTVVENVNITYDNDPTHNYKYYTSAAQHNIGDYIGRGADVNDTGNTGTANYVRGETAGTADELKTILGGYTTNSGDNITIELTKDFDMANNWTTYNIGNYNGVNSLTINGNGHKITNLNAPLIMGAFAGSGVITINDLTISNANISQNGANLGLGAFVMHSDASGGVVFKNCKLENSVIECTGADIADGSAYAGGFIGYSSSANTTFTGCTVTDCQISGQKSAGALIGHAQTNLTVDGCTVTGNTISETLQGRINPGAAAIVGRVSAGSSITVKNTTVSGNTIKQGAAVTTLATSVVCANASYTNGGNNNIQELPQP